MRRIFLLLACVFCFCAAPSAFAYGVTHADKYPNVVSREDIETVGVAYIGELIAESGETRRTTVEAVHIPREIRTPDGDVSFSPSAKGGVRYWGNTAVYVDVIVDGETFRRIKCQFKVHLFDDVAVAAKPIQPGSPISASDFRFEEQEIGSKGGKFITREDELVGRIVSRPINIGSPILRTMVRLPVIIESGAPVTIIARNGDVEVKMDGVALQPGREGDHIRVRNTSSRRIIRGRVVDENTVEISS